MRTPLRFLETLESRIQPAVNFSDDFNSFLVQPDTSKWAHYQQNVVGKPYNADWLSKDYNNANVKYTNTTSTLSIVSDAGALDGKALKMTLIRDPNSPTQFLSSEIATAIPSTFNIQSGTVQYGRIEVRAKLPGGPGASGYGVFPSFYLLGSNVNTGAHWPICGEIDVFENKGSTPGQIQSAIHGPGYTGHELTTTTDLPDGEAFYSAYHTFAVDWAPNAISYSLDGNIYKTFTPADVANTAAGQAGANAWPTTFNHPFFMILQLSAGAGPGTFAEEPTDQTSFPQSMYVDYVRAFAMGPTVSAVTPSTATITSAQVGGTFTLTTQYNAPMNPAISPVINFDQPVNTILNYTSEIWNNDHTIHTASYSVINVGVSVNNIGITISGAQDTDSNYQVVFKQSNVFSVISTNHAPELSDTDYIVLNSVFQNADTPTGPVGTLVSTIVAVANITDQDINPTYGIAISAIDSSKGTWFFTVNNGTTWSVLLTATENSSLLLAADANTRVFFQPSHGVASEIYATSFIFRAWDRTSGVNGSTANTSARGGITPYSVYGKQALITIDMAPSLTPTTGTVGSSVTVNGSNLQSATVKFGGISASYISGSYSQLVVTAPANLSGTVNVIVSTASSSVTLIGAYSYIVVPPTSPSITVDDGLSLLNGITPTGFATYSRLTSLELTFASAVTNIDAGAFTLVNGAFTLVSGGSISVAGVGTNVLRLTFIGSNTTPGIEYSSLIDGIWSLTTNLTKVHNLAGVGTGNVITTNIRRLFGDVNGTGTVDGGDFGLFGSTFGLNNQDPNFNSQFDVNADGSINGGDFGPFGSRFGTGL